METERTIDPSEREFTLASPETLAKFYGERSIEAMAKRENIPERASILGIGKGLSQLADEITFYRADVHWTNVASSDDKVATEPKHNLEFMTWDTTSLTDIFPEESFDNIFVYDDIDEASVESLKALLKNGGTLAYPGEKSAKQFTQTRVTYGEPYLVSVGTEPTVDYRVEQTVGPLSSKPLEYLDELKQKLRFGRMIGAAVLGFVLDLTAEAPKR